MRNIKFKKSLDNKTLINKYLQGGGALVFKKSLDNKTLNKYLQGGLWYLKDNYSRMMVSNEPEGTDAIEDF